MQNIYRRSSTLRWLSFFKVAFFFIKSIENFINLMNLSKNIFETTEIHETKIFLKIFFDQSTHLLLLKTMYKRRDQTTFASIYPTPTSVYFLGTMEHIMQDRLLNSTSHPKRRRRTQTIVRIIGYEIGAARSAQSDDELPVLVMLGSEHGETQQVLDAVLQARAVTT